MAIGSHGTGRGGTYPVGHGRLGRRPTSARALFLFLFLNSDPGRSRHIPHALVARRSGLFAFECVCGSCCYNRPQFG
jgi:hypothetical protein